MRKYLRLCSKRPRGFTLIEVTVALAIMALTSAVLYQSFAWSLRRGATLRSQELAWMMAESLLAQVRGAHSIAEGHQEGETPEGWSWQEDIETYPLDLDSNSRVRAYRVTIDVQWGTTAARSVRLESVELGYVFT